MKNGQFSFTDMWEIRLTPAAKKALRYFYVNQTIGIEDYQSHFCKNGRMFRAVILLKQYGLITFNDDGSRVSITARGANCYEHLNNLDRITRRAEVRANIALVISAISLLWNIINWHSSL